jgi:hypothetical protein
VTTTSGPEGSWPLHPQVPSYEQPGATPCYPAPSSQHVPPRKPTYPGETPSVFAPASQPNEGQPYAEQPQYGPPGVSWPRYESASDNLQPDRVPAKYRVMAIVAVVLIAAIGVGVVVWSMSWTPRTTAASVWTAVPTPTSTRTVTATPSSTPKPSTVSNCSGSAAETTGWQAVIPSGWTCEYEAGAEVFIVDELFDTIMVSASQDDPATACSTDLARQARVTPLPDTAWGGKVSKTAGIKLRDYDGQARCVFASGWTYVMFGVAGTGTIDQLVAAENSLAQAWYWKF